MTTEEKRKLIDPNYSPVSVKRQCELLGLSRSSYYYQALTINAETEKLMQLIDEYYTAHPHEGARKISRWLKNQKGYEVGRKRVLSLMKQMGLEAIYPKPNLSAPSKGNEVYPYLLREIDIKAHDKVWSCDITYLPTTNGHVYLMAIIDWHSRYVLEWEVSISLETDFCLAALDRALAKGRCHVFNTDQGSQFTSTPWIERLKKSGISISMDGRGRFLDNIFIERLWRSVKYECIYLNHFESVREIKNALEQYFNYYNYERLHQSLDYQTPADVYFKNKNN